MIKESIQQEYVAIINIYTPHYKSCGYLKELLQDLPGDLYSITIELGEINTQLSAMVRSFRQKITK